MPYDKREAYIPALSYDWLTPLYDPLLRWSLRESAIKGALVEQACVNDIDRVLDLGCGTGTLMLLLKQRSPGTEVAGIDGDPKILEMARRKAAKAGLNVTLSLGLADELPYGDDSFDRVLSSLVLHHLTPESKRRAASEVLRVLKPGGQLHVADFGRPQSRLMRALAHLMVAGHGGERMAENVAGRLPLIFLEAGFVEAFETRRFTTIFGTVSCYRAEKRK